MYNDIQYLIAYFYIIPPQTISSLNLLIYLCHIFTQADSLCFSLSFRRKYFAISTLKISPAVGAVFWFLGEALAFLSCDPAGAGAQET